MPTIKAVMDDIAECRRAHDRLIVDIAELDDRDVAAASHLPDWTRGHVLSHLASNAESIVRRLTAAREGRLVDQYVNGAAGRRREIAERSTLPATELIELVQQTASEVDELFQSFPLGAWERPIRALDGPDRPAYLAVFSRWREVEAHHVDLDLGYEVRGWPDTLVDRCLPSALQGLPERTNHHNLLGWLIGRGPAPRLEPWG